METTERNLREYKNLLLLLELLKGVRDTNTGRNQINQYEHSMQTAQNAIDEGAEDWLVAVALLHDIGKSISEINHPEIGAAIVRNKLGDSAADIVFHHAEFQADLLHARDIDRSEFSWYNDCKRLCEWDAKAFELHTLKISHYLPFIEKFWL